jgi:polysaccharide biosynthesis protein PslH
MTSSNHDLVYLTPIAPAATGNGLAMRGLLFLEAASADFQVKVLVVPVAGIGQVAARAAISVLAMPDSRQVAASVPELMASPQWRERIIRAYPLPQLAALAPATLAVTAERTLGARPGTPVHVARSYLAPLGIALAERIGSDWATLDLDDDDEQLAASAGDLAAAAGFGRLITVFGPLFSGLALAAPAEAAAVARRHGLATTVLPNAITAPEPRSSAFWRTAGEGISVLFVGNLSYWPNADAAIRLVREVLPRLRRLTARPVTVTLVGRTGANPELRSLTEVPGVRLTGFAADLSPVYGAADVVAAPLVFAAGTRIKLLEAFSRGVPVVTTTPGAAGLGVVSGQHALIADTPGEMARAVVRLASDDPLRAWLITSARELVRQNYSYDAVVPQIRTFFATAASSGPAAGHVMPASATSEDGLPVLRQ